MLRKRQSTCGVSIYREYLRNVFDLWTGAIYSNAGPLRKRWHLDFSSVNDEKSLVSTAFRTERERAQIEYIAPV